MDGDGKNGRGNDSTGVFFYLSFFTTGKVIAVYYVYYMDILGLSLMGSVSL